MSFSDTDVKERYVGNGANTDFAIPFAFNSISEIKVMTRDESTTPPTEATKVITTHYTLIGGPPVTTVRFNTAPASGIIVVVVRENAYTQTTSYAAAGPFPNASHEAAIDKLTRLVQEVKEMVLRSPKLQITSEETGLELPDKDTGNEGKTWILNAAGTAMEWGPDVADLEALMDALIAAEASAAASAAAAAASAADAAISAATAAAIAGDWQEVEYTGDGSDVTFNLPADPGVEGNIFVAVDGFVQPGSSYSYVGTVLTFSEAPPNGAAIHIKVGRAVAVGTVAPGSIVDASVASNAAITLSKLAALTASRLLVSDGSGVITPSSVTSTEAGYLSGVTSALQTQLNNLSALILAGIDAVLGLAVYANDAAYVAANGAAEQGDFYYNSTLLEIRVYNGTVWGGAGGGALSVTGTRGAPQSITAAGGIAFTGTPARQMWFVQGNGAAAIDITANPQVAAGNTVGQELIIVGTSDTATVQLDHGTGLDLNGSIILANSVQIGLMWDGTTWCEMFRRG